VRPGEPLRGRRKAPAPVYARALERGYTRELGAITRRMVRLTRRALDGVRVPGPTRADAAGPDGVDWDRLRIRLGRLADSSAAEIVAKYGRRMGRFSAQEIERILGIDVSNESPELSALIEAWQRDNVALIRSIGEELHEDVREVVAEAAARGTRVETLATRLLERYDVTESRARLIARDQIAKGNAALNQARMGAAGITEYVWSTSRDERVRDSHKELEGRVFRFSAPPLVAPGRRCNPGEDYQCRCVAIPVLAPLDKTAEKPQAPAVATKAPKTESVPRNQPGFGIYGAPPGRPGDVGYFGFSKTREAAERRARQSRGYGATSVEVREQDGPGPR
jgi:SPP1 gp7 family putative phage head morphogenesis protein